MLAILFGSTVQMGKRSREYFQEKGFELIQKYHYVPEDFVLISRFDKRQADPLEKVQECDFIYDNSGMLVGFKKEQIIDAVRGRKKCLLAVSSDTIDFIRQIKAAYGDYVTVIGTYIDNRTLRTMYEALPDISEREVERRLDLGLQIKKALLEDRKLFDYIVMYGGEDSEFNCDSLEIQYDYMLAWMDRLERELNNRMYVELPYSGRENYIFVSYSHGDVRKVFPVLRKLQLSGYRIWYDEGINGGENWRKIIASKIEDEKCRQFLLFSSERSTASDHVEAEVRWALKNRKKLTRINLDEASFDSDLEMYLEKFHHLSRPEDPGFDRQLMKALDESTRIKS